MTINPFDLLEYDMSEETLISLTNPKNYDITEDVKIPSAIDGKTLTQIERIADLNHVVSLTIPVSIVNIKHRNYLQSVFLRCDSLQQITIYDSLKIFGDAVLSEIVEKTDEKGYWSSKDDRGETINGVIEHVLSTPLNETCTIKNDSFYKCPKFRKLIIKHAENSNGIIQPALFKGVHELKEVVIGNGVKIIGDDAFAYCLNLEKIVIPPSVTGIRFNAFHYDTKLEIYGASGSYAQKYAEWFGFPFHISTETDELN